MHIVIGALGSIVTILWILHRLAEMGVGLGGLNPWLWRRRRKWRATYEANPVYAVTRPMEATALLIAATAKADGDLSLDEKQAILRLFKRDFHLSERDAAALLTSSTHLLGNGDEVRDNLAGVLKPSLDSFSESQTRSAVAMIEEIAAVGGAPSQLQTDFVDQVRLALLQPANDATEWS
jgi:uncharacterized tellurite resistance protein B-like protein